MTDQVREPEVLQALRFLQDPRVLNAPRQQKESFLVSKGLSSAEVSQALARADAALPFLSPPPSTSVWSMVATAGAFVAAMGAGAFLYQLWKDQEPPAPQTDLKEAIEELRASLRDMSVSQEVRSKDQLKLLKEIVAQQQPTEILRKPASSIILDVPACYERAEDDLIAELRESAVLPTVLMILQNLIAYPTEDKYRKVNLSNARFKEKIANGVGFDVLRVAGFVKVGDSLNYTNSDLSDAERVLHALESVAGA